MARVKLDTSADTRGAKQLNAELAKTDKELDEITKSARGAAGQARKLAEMAEPQKKYNREMATLAKHVKAGRLSMEQAEKVAGKYQRRLDRTADAGKRAVGPAMAGNIQGMIAGYTSMAGAVGLVTKALADQEQKAQEAADAIFQSLDSFGKLQQLSDSPEQLERVATIANKLIYSGAVAPDNRSLAYDTAFSFNSAGLDGQSIEALSKLAADRIIPASGLSEFAGKAKKIQDIYGTEEAGSMGLIVDKILAASKSAQSDAPTIAGEIAKFGGLAASLGFSDESSVAAFLASEKQSDTPAAAAERMKSLFAQMKKRDLAKGTLAESVDAIQSRVAGGEKIFDILGEQNAVIGFEDIMRRRDVFDAQSQAMLNASGTAARSAGLINTSPEHRAALSKARSQGRVAEAMAVSGQSERENLFDAVANDRYAARVSEGRPFMANVLGALERLDDYFQRETAGMYQGAIRGQLSPETLEDVKGYYRDRGDTETLELIERHLDKMANGGGGGRQE